MNKAVIYFGATGNEAADQMVMQVLEEYCTVNCSHFRECKTGGNDISYEVCLCRYGRSRRC